MGITGSVYKLLTKCNIPQRISVPRVDRLSRISNEFSSHRRIESEQEYDKRSRYLKQDPPLLIVTILVSALSFEDSGICESEIKG